jgi:lysophospholipase L1-like esterase
MKIVFLGNSLTEGSYGGSYVKALRDKYPQHELINSGKGGNTVLNLLDRLENDALAHNPDGVFVMAGGNDAISYSQPKTRIYYEQVQDIPDGVVTPDQFSQVYREILETLRLNFIQTWVGLPPAEYNPAVIEAQQQYNQLAADAARAIGVMTLNLMPHFKPDSIPQRPPLDLAFIQEIGRRSQRGWSDYETARQENEFTYTFDGLHLLPESAEKIAQLIGEFLRL